MTVEAIERTEADLAARVISALSQLADVSVDMADHRVVLADSQFDLLIEGQARSQPFVLLVEIKAYGYPRDVRAEADKLAVARDQFAHTVTPTAVIPMFVAP